MAEATRGTALVVGAGDGLGSAIARAFAAEGYDVCITRRARHLDQLEALAASIREAGGRARAFGVDARSEDEMVALFATIERDVGPLEVVVFNIGANVRFPIRETTARVFTKVWEMACFAGFLTGREAAKVMVPRGRGSILFTGATASVRGRDGFAAFASAKHGLRAVAQSLARELGPQGVHVAHVVVDGAIDGVFTRDNRQDVEALLGRRRDPQARGHRPQLRHAPPSAAFGLDPRVGPAPLEGSMVMAQHAPGKTIDFIFDFGSPNAYLAGKLLPGIAERTGARINLIPCLLGGIFKATNNRSPMEAFGEVKGKLAYEQLETQRFIARHGLARFRFNPHFPVNTLLIMRGLIAAQRAGVAEAYLPAVLKGMWEEGQKMDDPAVVARGPDRRRPRRRGPAGRHRRSRGQGRADRQYRGRRRPRGVRHPDLLRRRRDVLRQGPPGPGRRGAGRLGRASRLDGVGRPPHELVQQVANGRVIGVDDGAGAVVAGLVLGAEQLGGDDIALVLQRGQGPPGLDHRGRRGRLRRRDSWPRRCAPRPAGPRRSGPASPRVARRTVPLSKAADRASSNRIDAGADQRASAI